MSIANVWRRHPRYFLFVVITIVATFLLLIPSEYRPSLKTSYYFHPISSDDLAARLAESDAIYEGVLKQREGAIRKFGPTPQDVQMYPADKAPWPAYTVWDFFPAAYNCPHEIRRIGAMGDGGKWVCGLSRLRDKKDCIVYSFGINGESSFEAELLSETRHCELWGYDFSVNSFGPEIQSFSKSRAHFYPYGLAGSDRPASGDSPEMYTLESLMRMNGHKHIDLVKIDIETWEFETLTTLVKSYIERGKPLPFGQMQLEIHAWNNQFDRFLKWWETLEAAGLRPFWTEPNLVYLNYHHDESAYLAEYSFLNVKGDNIFIKNPPSMG